MLLKLRTFIDKFVLVPTGFLMLALFVLLMGCSTSTVTDAGLIAASDALYPLMDAHAVALSDRNMDDAVITGARLIQTMDAVFQPLN